MRHVSSFILRRLMVMLFLSGGAVACAHAASDYDRNQTRSTKMAKQASTSLSCYATLEMMVRGSSLNVAHKVRSSLRLDVERDDGDHILLRVHRGGQSSEAAAWLHYHATRQILKDVSLIVQNEDMEAAFSGEYGTRLAIDRRLAQFFAQCRQRLDLEQMALCRQSHQKSQMDVPNLALRAQGRVARQDKGETRRITLYSAADRQCPLGGDIVMKAGTGLKIFVERDDFYFVRQDQFGQDFITGWILKNHVENIKYLTPPAMHQEKTIEVMPASKPAVAVNSDALSNDKPKTATRPPPVIVKAAPLPVLEPDFDVEQSTSMPVTTSKPAIATEEFVEEIAIPVPVMDKPSPSDLLESAPLQQRSRPAHRPRTNRRDG